MKRHTDRKTSGDRYDGEAKDRLTAHNSLRALKAVKPRLAPLGTPHCWQTVYPHRSTAKKERHEYTLGLHQDIL
jgi:hypothetical protein